MVKNTGRGGDTGQIMKSHICPIKELRHPISHGKPQRDLKRVNDINAFNKDNCRREDQLGKAREGDLKQGRQDKMI